MGRNRPYFPTPLAVIRNYAYPSMTKRLTASRATTNRGCLKQTTANAGTKTAESSPVFSETIPPSLATGNDIAGPIPAAGPSHPPRTRETQNAPNAGIHSENASAYGHASLARTSADSRIPTLSYINDPRGGPSIPKDPPLGHTTVDRPLRNPPARAALGPLLFLTKDNPPNSRASKATGNRFSDGDFRETIPYGHVLSVRTAL